MFADGEGMKTAKAIRLAFLLLMAATLLALWPMRFRIAAYAGSAFRQLSGQKPKSVDERLQQFGEAARNRWKPYFEQARVAYPPSRVVLVGLKDVDCLEIYAARGDIQPVLIRSIKVLAASGDLGPKLRKGDNQVPEGVYAVESLNPNSKFHVSLRVSYPNAFDREKGRLDGRQSLGGDIMIHGGAASIGCLAVGDEAAEDIFVLTADLELQNVTIVLCPTDLRVKNLPEHGYDWPSWYPELVAQLKEQLTRLPKTGVNGKL
jgi:hypothetical protein